MSEQGYLSLVLNAIIGALHGTDASITHGGEVSIYTKMCGTETEYNETDDGYTVVLNENVVKVFYLDAWGDDSQQLWEISMDELQKRWYTTWSNILEGLKKLCEMPESELHAIK